MKNALSFFLSIYSQCGATKCLDIKILYFSYIQPVNICSVAMTE